MYAIDQQCLSDVRISVSTSYIILSVLLCSCVYVYDASKQLLFNARFNFKKLLWTYVHVAQFAVELGTPSREDV